MVIPSNDAFVGTADSLQLFDENGHFMGEQNISFAGSDVLDAGLRTRDIAGPETAEAALVGTVAMTQAVTDAFEARWSASS